MNGRDLNGPPYAANQQGRGWDFPYKNMFTTSQSKGLITRFMKWLTFSIAYSFANSRSYLDKFLDLTGESVSKMPKFVPSKAASIMSTKKRLLLYETTSTKS